MTKSFKEEWAKWPRLGASKKNDQDNQDQKLQGKTSKKTKNVSFTEEQAKGLRPWVWRRNEQDDHDKELQGRMNNRTKVKSF
jgi:hypothetical protein